ncbi:MAG: TolC family protein, partial [Acidobacteria bacterium]|nr:TolC family protein [Acidobacteriota bacterium]
MRIENPTGQVTLREALALALMHSPDLAAFAWEVRAREARVLQAGLLPNPVFSVQAEDLGGSTDAASGQGLLQPQATIQLSQLIELGGKRAARQRLAESHQQLA